MQGLANGLVDRLDVETQHGSQPRGDGRTEVRNVVDLVLVQTHSARQIDLDLVGGGDASDQVCTPGADVLRHRDQRGDVVARVRVLGGEEGVVEVEFTHGHPVGPRGPLRGVRACDTEHRRAAAAPSVRVHERL